MQEMESVCHRARRSDRFSPGVSEGTETKESGSTAADDGCRDDIEKCENEHRTCDDDGLRVTMMMAMREVECGRWKPGE